MKLLDRYVLKELVIPFIIGTLAVVLMFQANMLIFILKNAPPTAVPVTATIQMILYKTPEFLVMTLPVGMALASSMAISRLTRETELTAMRVAGAPILRVVFPVMVFGLLVGVGNFFVAEKLQPIGSKKFREISAQAAIMGGVPEFKSNVNITLGNYSGHFGSIQRDKESTRIMFNDATLFERPRAKEVQIHAADSGYYKDGVFVLQKAKTWRIRDDVVEIFIPNKDVTIKERIVIQDIFLSPESGEQTLEELRKSIEQGKRIGRDMTWQQVQYHVRYSVPATCLIFALVAPVFAVQFARSGAFLGVMLSIVLVFLYYNAHIVSTEIFGRNGILSPWLAAWLPNIIFLALGLIGIRRLE